MTERYIPKGFSSRSLDIANFELPGYPVDLEQAWKQAMTEVFPHILIQIQRGDIPPLANIRFRYSRENWNFRVAVAFTYLEDEQICALTTEDKVRI